MAFKISQMFKKYFVRKYVTHTGHTWQHRKYICMIGIHLMSLYIDEFAPG